VKKFWYLVALLGLVAVVVILLVIWKPPNDTGAKERVRLGISPFQDTLLPIISAKKGWYEAEGLDVELKVLGWTEVQEALAAGSVDVAINNISAVVSTHHKNPEFVYAYGFNTFDDGFALMIRPNGPMKPLGEFLKSHATRAEAVAATARQLKGREVVTTSNTDMEQGVAAAARRGGLDFKKDVKIIDLNPDEGLAAFLTGKGDAYIGGIPQRTRASKEGMLELLTGADLGPPPINGFVTTKRFAIEKQEVLLKLLKVWFRTVNYVNDNTDEAGSIIVHELNSRSGAKFTLDDFKLFWNKIEHYPANPEEIENEILKPAGRNYWKARWDDCNVYFFDIAGRIPRRLDPDGIFIMPQSQAAYIAKYGKSAP
jgi:ABC-type nitrate/sulfonate/bicarbonate transport system substrate-binding protein